MNDDDFMDITPDVHYLQSIRAERGSWTALIAEGVDNSLDADANEIDVQLLPNAVTLADNGRGITKSRESAIVRLGGHGPMPSTKLGRFGIGIKYNACSAGDLLKVESASEDGHMVLVVDWPKIIRSGKWRVPRSIWTPRLVSRGSFGTTIGIERLVWIKPTDKDVASVRAYLAQIFYPAIANGARMRLNGSAIDLLSEPELSDVVDRSVQLPNGKGAHVRGGMLVHRDYPLYQVQVSYKHRVIKPKSLFGCGTFTGTRRMFARVTLTADWGLSRFKDDVIDDDAPALEAAVTEVLRPILEKCDSTQMDLKVDDLTDLLNDLLPPEIQAARPPRRKEDASKGASKRKRRQHNPTTSSPAEDGPARMPKAMDNRLRISFDEPLCAEHGYGVFTKGRPSRITLARDNPNIAMALNHRDRQLAVRYLFDVALMLYRHALDTEPGQATLPFDGSASFGASFGLRVWNIAKRQDVVTDEAVS